ncbi:sensor histidine kinase [Erythrobacter sp.]|uniref:sensor histidine kinase n=1 Tax=Erythrobacter sp. TaxID=1042 RepID=UPI003C76FCF9
MRNLQLPGALLEAMFDVMPVPIPREADMIEFFDSAPIGFSLLDADLRYIRVNKALADINGLPVEAHIGKLQHELIPDVDDAIAAVQRRVIAEGRPSTGHKVRVQTPAYPGVPREFEVDYFPVPDGEGGNHLGCCVYESSDSTQLLDALEEEGERTRALTDNLTSFLAILAPDGTVCDVNAPALDVLDLRLSDVRGMPFWECPWWNYDESMAATIRELAETAMGGSSARADVCPRVTDGFIVVDVRFAPLARRDGQVSEIVVSGIDVTAQRELERKRHIQTAELQHRMKNIFATIQSLTRMLASHSRDLVDFRERFDLRIAALARTNDALMTNEWSDLSARDLITLELAPYLGRNSDPISITGSDCRIGARDAATLNLAIHELVTNAAKHGALSVEEGRVEIAFESGSNGMLSSFTWRERGGPPFDQGAHGGFGSILLERVVPGMIRMEASIERSPEGLTYRLG